MFFTFATLSHSMPIQVVLPLLKSNSISVKDGIVSILAFEEPLSVKSLHTMFIHRRGVEVTYQAVHKAVKELESHLIVSRSEQGYSLNKEWIHSLRKFTEDVLEKQRDKIDLSKILSEGGTTNLYFESVAESDKFLIESIDFMITNNKEQSPKPLYMYWNHGWTPLFFSKDAYKKAGNIALNKSSFVLLKGNSPLDAWVGNVLGKIGAGLKTKLGVDTLEVPDFMAYENYVFQVFYPKKILDQIDSVYRKVQRIEDLDVDKIYSSIFEQKVGIPVIVTCNPPLFRQLSEKVKDYF
jgi:hypothetical protein